VTVGIDGAAVLQVMNRTGINTGHYRSSPAIRP
jgi:hypothetical protein